MRQGWDHGPCPAGSEGWGGSQIRDQENYNGWDIDGVSRDRRHSGVKALSSGGLHRWELGGEEQLGGKGKEGDGV